MKLKEWVLILFTIILFVWFMYDHSKKSYEIRQLKSQVQEIIHLQKENAQLKRIIELSEKYTLLARVCGYTHEVSVVEVKSILFALEKYDKYNFSPEDILSVGLIESGNDPKAKSTAGALGKYQIMPNTGKEFGVDDPQRLYNLDVNLETCIKILNDYAERFQGDKRLALLAYNRGPEKVQKVLSLGKSPSNKYDDKVIGIAPKSLK